MPTSEQNPTASLCPRCEQELPAFPLGRDYSQVMPCPGCGEILKISVFGDQVSVESP